MKEYLLLWRFFPKMAIGAVFVAEVLMWIFGFNKTLNLLIIVGAVLSRHFSGVTLLIVIALIVAIVANLGVFLLNFLSSALLDLLDRVIRGGNERVRAIKLAKMMVEPLPEVSIRVFNEEPTLQITFLKLRSFAAAKYEKKKVLESFIGEVTNHLTTIKHVRDTSALNFYTALGQDRRTYEIALDEIQLLWNLVIVCLLGIPSILIHEISRGHALMLVASLVVCVCAAIAAVIRRKRFWAVFWLCAYLDNFSFGDFVEMVDREGETML